MAAGGRGVVRTGAEKFGPQSLAGLVAWFVVGLIVVTHPVGSAKAAWTASWGTARWVGYMAFADCDEPPPFTWMAPKECPVPGQTPPAGLVDAEAGVVGPLLSTPDTFWDRADAARDLAEQEIVEPLNGESGGGDEG